MAKEFYKRKLPHWHPPNSVFALTYNLYGSLPKHILKQLLEERDDKIKSLERDNLDEKEQEEALKNIHALHFGKYDELLDNPQNQIQHLKQPEIAKLVLESLHYLNNNVWKMVCCCVMSNHVHLVVYKLEEPLKDILQSHKSFTGRKANALLGLSGKFWEEETYDRKIRDRKEFTTQVRYTLFNPVKAGLVKHWEDWKYSWIREEFRKYEP